jgi:hypothetical protein
MVIPEGAALDTAQLPVVEPPDEPPVATPDEPLVATPDEPPPLLPEDDIAPVDDPPLDGLPVTAPEPVVGDMDPDVNPVPLLVDPLLVDPLVLLASGNGIKSMTADACPACSWTPQHAANTEVVKQCHRRVRRSLGGNRGTLVSTAALRPAGGHEPSSRSLTKIVPFRRPCAQLGGRFPRQWLRDREGDSRAPRY